ncbi:MAG: YegS/Rv2252/BmrU family lipid kinase [Pseudomonadota bacterium]
MERLLAIVNPAAGGGGGKKEGEKAIGRFRSAGFSVEVAETSRPGDASRIATEAYANGERNFVSVGGDGTGFEIVNGLFPVATEKQERPSLGFVPVGTGNSFLRDFTNAGTQYAIDSIVSHKKRSCDVLRVRHTEGTLYFLNLLTIGFAAEVAALRNRRFTALGEFGYILATFAKLATLDSHPIPFRVDDAPFDREPVTFISINNSRYTGGHMLMAPEADTSDGYADLIRVAPLGRLALVRAFPRIFKGTHTLLPAVTCRRVKRIDFDLDRKVVVQIDGETLTLQPERVDVMPSALEVCA